MSESTARADATLTLALPKTGLEAEGAREFIGDLFLADIGLPPALYARPPLNIPVEPLFRDQYVIALAYL